MNKLFDVIFAIGGIVGLIVIIGLAMAIPTWLLWNACIVGTIQGVGEIGIWQAWGINILSGILFKTNISKKD